MSNKIKLIITLLLCIGVVLSVVFDEFLWNIVLLVMLLAKKSLFKILMVLKQFFFKKGVISFATVAWKKVMVSSSLALSKRAIINTATGFFQERIVKPLIHPLTRYIKVRWKMFKASTLWQKTYTVLFGSIPASILLWIVGIWEALALLLKSFSLAKLLTMILKLIVTFFVFFQNIWRSWIQPYLDFIIITIFVTYMEKIPFIGGVMRKIRVTIKWKWRHYKRHKDRIIDRHVDQNVNLFSERIHQHVNKKKELMAESEKSAASTDDGERTLDSSDLENAPELSEIEDSLPEEELEKIEEDAEKVGRVIQKIDGVVKSGDDQTKH
jgi:hypothetical protein